MKDTITRGRKVLYYALVIACVFAILKMLYDTGYNVYMLSEHYKNVLYVEETPGYKIFNSSFLKYAVQICFYAGLVSVYAFWKKPRPTWVFVMVVAAGFLPRIASSIISELLKSNIALWDYVVYFNIAIAIFSSIWIIAKLIFIMKLFKNAEKKAKLIMLFYVIIFYLGAAMSLIIIFVILGEALQYTFIYINRFAEIVLYIFTLIYLKKKLGENMPFTKTLRMLKKECTNKLPE